MRPAGRRSRPRVGERTSEIQAGQDCTPVCISAVRSPTTAARRRSHRLPAHFSADALFQMLNIEVNQQPDSLSGKPQVRQQLRFMNRQNRRERLYLDDHGILDQDIDSVPKFDVESVILDGYHLLLDMRDPSHPKLVTQTRLIRSFKQPWTELRVHFVRGIQNRLRDVAVDQQSAMSSVIPRVLRVEALGRQAACRVACAVCSR